MDAWCCEIIDEKVMVMMGIIPDKLWKWCRWEALREIDGQLGGLPVNTAFEYRCLL